MACAGPDFDFQVTDDLQGITTERVVEGMQATVPHPGPLIESLGVHHPAALDGSGDALKPALLRLGPVASGQQALQRTVHALVEGHLRRRHRQDRHARLGAAGSGPWPHCAVLPSTILTISIMGVLDDH